MQEHRCSCTVVPLLKQFNSFEFWKGCGVSRSIYLTTFFGRTSIIYVVRDISFQPKTTYPTFRRAVPNTEVSLILYRSHGQSRYAVYIPTQRKVYRSLLYRSWRPCPTAFLLRSGEFIPRHPVIILLSRCEGAKFAPHSLFGKKIKFAPKLIKKIFQLPQNRHFSVVNCHGSFLDFRRILSFRHWFIAQEKMLNQVKFRRL